MPKTAPKILIPKISFSGHKVVTVNGTRSKSIDSSTVGQWINSNLSAFANVFSSVRVPAAALTNKHVHFSWIDDGSA